MESVQVQVNSEIVACPSCRTELELDRFEAESRNITCPNCEAEFDLSPTSISDITQELLQTGRIPLDGWDKIDLWYAPLLFLGIAVAFLLFDSNADLPFDLLPYVLFAFGIFHTYRAVTSARLTFIPSLEILERKVSIVRDLQNKFRWTLTHAKDGSFLFIDRNGLNPREIIFICTDEGFYFNCFVHSSGAGSGISIVQTRKIIKAIEHLTDKSYQPPLSYLDYCPKCAHFRKDQGICSRLRFNVERYPTSFVNKCDSKYFRHIGAA